MAYQMAATVLILNDLQGHSQVACRFNCNPSKIYAVFTRLQLTVCWRCLYVSWTSRMNRDTTDKRIVYSKNTESG